jgi:hypothetical protein
MLSIHSSTQSLGSIPSKIRNDQLWISSLYERIKILLTASPWDSWMSGDYIHTNWSVNMPNNHWNLVWQFLKIKKKKFLVVFNKWNIVNCQSCYILYPKKEEKKSKECNSE